MEYNYTTTQTLPTNVLEPNSHHYTSTLTFPFMDIFLLTHNLKSTEMHFQFAVDVVVTMYTNMIIYISDLHQQQVQATLQVEVSVIYTLRA